MLSKFTVEAIPKEQTHEWLLKKHYAKRIPPIIYSFGLYDSNALVGICTFGTPCRAYNNGEFVFHDHQVKTFELNRLCTNSDLPRNANSFFVARAIKLLPSPCCIVSYADHNQGHHGFIYQACNFIYTGLNEIHDTEYIIDGKRVHSRTLTAKGITAPKEWARNNGIETTDKSSKHRYFLFSGTKREIKTMRRKFRIPIMPYPKGDNTRYDDTQQISIQMKF